VAWLKETATVRNALLERYGTGRLRVGEPASDLTSRFPLIYLFHRYALAAAINVIGGAKIPPSITGDGVEPITVWPAAGQREALRLALKALEPGEMEIPPRLWKLLAPPEPGREDAERFGSSGGYLFSPHDAARALSEIVSGGLLNSRRLARLFILTHEQVGAPSPEEVVGGLVRAAFAGGEKGPGSDLAGVVQTDVAERLMLLSADPGATPEVQAAALAGVEDVRRRVQAGSSPLWRRLSREIGLFMTDPRQNAPQIKSSGAPPGPPV